MRSDESLREWLERRRNPTDPNTHNKPLLDASWDNDVKEVRRLLSAGADVNTDFIYPRTPLHQASIQGHDAVVKVLLEAGAEVDVLEDDVPHRYHETALCSASTNGHATVVKMLLDAGADPDGCGNRRRKLRWTPLRHAIHNGHDAVVKLLLEAGASIHWKLRNDGTLLHDAMYQGEDSKIVKLLMDAGAGVYVHKKNSMGETPLSLAMRDAEDDEIIDLLTEQPSKKQKTEK